MAPGVTYHPAVTAFKRALLAETLSRHGGNRTRAARELGLNRTYLGKLILDLAVPCAAPRVSAKWVASRERAGVGAK